MFTTPETPTVVPEAAPSMSGVKNLDDDVSKSHAKASSASLLPPGRSTYDHALHYRKREYVSSSELTTWLLLSCIKRRTIVICVV
jgi:hypothetical protein